MSTGRRLAKRSIVGTKVCAQGPDGLWYSGVVQDVKTPSSSSSILDTSHQFSEHQQSNSANITTPDTIYLVRFDFKTQTQQMDTTKNTVIMDARQQHQNRVATTLYINPAQSLRRNAMTKEFRETDLIGPGFRSIMGVQLHPGQRVFLTYNGRETSADVISHDLANDEVIVKIAVAGNEETIELKKRLEEVRLLESRRSARLADQDRDTDFARLADMGGDRRRTSHSIDVPLPLTPQHNSRKRRPSSSQEDHENFLTQFRNDDEMNACNAALVLMSLSCSPLSPSNADKWVILGSSPGSSSASWSSGSSSPPLSDDGQITHSNILNDAASARIRTTSLSTSDEGIVMDYNEDVPRKLRAHKPIFKCTWKGCDFLEHTSEKIERHIRNAHIGHKKARHSVEYDGSFSESDHEEEFYYTEIEDEDDEGKSPSPPSPPTLSHRDMARPPHEDPEYQRQIVGNFKNRHGLAQYHSTNGRSVYQQQHHMNANQHGIVISTANNAGNIPTSPLAHHNYTWSSVPSSTSSISSSMQSSIQHQSLISPLKHARWSPRPSTSTAPYPFVHYHHHHKNNHQHHNYSQNSGNSCNLNSGGNNVAVAGSGSHVVSHSNSSAKNVLQQLSQQNVTVTGHSNNSQQIHLAQCPTNSTSTISISPNVQQQTTQQHQIHHQISQNQPISSKVASANASNTNNNNKVMSSLATNGTISIVATSTATASHNNHHNQQYNQSTGVTISNRSPQSPNRRTRGENKKCRKVYGMEKRDQWCTQCKWKKACSRFGD